MMFLMCSSMWRPWPEVKGWPDVEPAPGGPSALRTALRRAQAYGPSVNRLYAHPWTNRHSASPSPTANDAATVNTTEKARARNGPEFQKRMRSVPVSGAPTARAVAPAPFKNPRHGVSGALIRSLNPRPPTMEAEPIAGDADPSPPPATAGALRPEAHGQRPRRESGTGHPASSAHPAPYIPWTEFAWRG